MRRQKALSVRVKAPSRGLVSRYPSDTADLFGPSDRLRVSTRAENVRFEDGVMRNAPGYNRAQVITPLLVGALAHWRFEEATGTRRDSHGSSHLSYSASVYPPLTPERITGKVNFAVRLAAVPIGPSLVGGTLSYFGSAWESLHAGDFTFTGWVRVSALPASGSQTLVAWPKVSVQVSSAGNLELRAVPVVGFPSVTTLGSIAVNTWKHVSVVHDATANTLTCRVDNGSDVVVSVDLGGVAATGGGVTFSPADGVANHDYDSTTFWTRKLTSPELGQIFNTGDGYNYPFINGPANLIFQASLTDGTRPTFLGTSDTLYSGAKSYNTATGTFDLTLTEIYSGAAATSAYRWRAADFYDKVFFAQKENIPQVWQGSATTDLPGLSVNADQYSATITGNAKFEGVTTFAGHVLLWRGDLFKWSDLDDHTLYIPVATTVTTGVYEVDAPGFTQPAVGGTVAVPIVSEASAASLVAGQYMRIVAGTAVNYYSVSGTPTATSITLRLLGTTGRTASAGAIAAGLSVETVDANESGEAQVVGAGVNGPIYAIEPMGDYAYILKERSISSLQYTPGGASTFLRRDDLTNEGIISRSAYVNLGDGRLVILGQRGLYEYRGGPQPTPICEQFTRQLLEELDRANLDKVLLHHHAERSEVWIQYPTAGGLRVLIWNYKEDTATLDTYEAALVGFSAIGPVDWITDPPWYRYALTDTWERLDDGLVWTDLAASGTLRLTFAATGNGEMLVFGKEVYTRNGEAYTAVAETIDFDLGDDCLFKYVDVVHVGLQIKATDTTERKLYIQTGSRRSMDADIVWSDPQELRVEGNGNDPCKVNPGGAGRFIRLRFYSEDADVQWRVSWFSIYARAGGVL